MPTPVDTAFEELFEGLRRAGGLRQKVALVARSSRLIRGLSAEQREALAVAFGSRWAWRRLQRLLTRDGVLSEGDVLVGDLLQELGSDPHELRRVAAAVRRGRVGALGEVLARVAERRPRREEDGAGEVEAPGEEDQPRSAEETGGRAAPPSREVASEPPDRERTGGDRELPPPASAPLPTLDSTVEVASPPPVEAEVPPTLRIEAEAAAVRAAPTGPRPEVAAPGHRAETFDQPATRQAAEPSEVLPTDATHLATLSALSRRGVGAATADQRRRLLGRLGEGWPGRRALSEMIRSGRVTDLDEALSLVRRLAPAGRSWCLGDLVELWDLEGDDLRRVLEEAPTAAARRRLTQRAAVRSRRPPGSPRPRPAGSTARG